MKFLLEYNKFGEDPVNTIKDVLGSILDEVSGISIERGVPKISIEYIELVHDYDINIKMGGEGEAYILKFDGNIDRSDFNEIGKAIQSAFESNFNRSVKFDEVPNIWITDDYVETNHDRPERPSSMLIMDEKIYDRYGSRFIFFKKLLYTLIRDGNIITGDVVYEEISICVWLEKYVHKLGIAFTFSDNFDPESNYMTFNLKPQLIFNSAGATRSQEYRLGASDEDMKNRWVQMFLYDKVDMNITRWVNEFLIFGTGLDPKDMKKVTEENKKVIKNLEKMRSKIEKMNLSYKLIFSNPVDKSVNEVISYIRNAISKV